MAVNYDLIGLITATIFSKTGSFMSTMFTFKVIPYFYLIENLVYCVLIVLRCNNTSIETTIFNLIIGNTTLTDIIPDIILVVHLGD